MPDHGQSGPLRAWLEGPADAPVVVLGNSLGTTTAVWAEEVAALTAEFRLLRFELPGHGGAASWPGQYSIARLGQAVLDVLDEHGLDRVAYWGVSLGGMIGMWLGAHAPARIAALGLVCTSAHLPPAEAWRDRARRVRAGELAAVADQVVARWFTPEYAASHPAVIDAFTADFRRTEAEGYAGCCEAIAAMNLLGDLPSISAPALVLSGSDDPATPPEHGAAIADRIGGARLVVLPAAAHLAPVSSPGPVSAELISQLRAAASAGQTWRDQR